VLAALVPAFGHESATDQEDTTMTTLSIIGTGNMARAIGSRAAEHGHTVEFLGRSRDKAQALAEGIGPAAMAGTYGTKPAGDIVIIAVTYADAVHVVKQQGQALAGKVLVDITNPFNDDATGVVTTLGRSVSEQIAAVAPHGAHVVKAFNTIFGGVLADAAPVDAFFAGDDAEAKRMVSEFVTSIDMRPRDVGGLRMAHALEWGGILLVGIASNGAGFDTALMAEVR
jgi:predicted dinucleotide-binding enzyme